MDVREVLFVEKWEGFCFLWVREVMIFEKRRKGIGELILGF